MCALIASGGVVKEIRVCLCRNSLARSRWRGYWHARISFLLYATPPPCVLVLLFSYCRCLLQSDGNDISQACLVFVVVQIKLYDMKVSEHLGLI